MPGRPKTVSEYIAAAPADKRARLKELRRIIRAVAPRAEEKISYGMPSYAHRGPVAYFACAKEHIGLYIPPPIVGEHASELSEYKTSKSAVQFPLSGKLPVGLIRKLLKARMRKNEERGVFVVCSRGHRFLKNKEHPVCPECWPGRYRRKPSP